MVSDRLINCKQFTDFKKGINNGVVSHAYLILSADTESRSIFCDLVSEALLCPLGGCTDCPVCKKIIARVHPDVKWYNADGKMKVSDAETLIEDTYIKGWESEKRLYFVDSAEKLSASVQNKLLKIYEEPPEGVIIFLLAGSEAGILQTISSRAKKLSLPSFSAAEIYDELIGEGVERRTAETASVFADGRFDRAHLYTESDGYVELYDGAFEILNGCKKSSDVADFINDKAFSKDNIAVTLEIIEIILRDVLGRVSGSKLPVKTVNRDYDIEEISRGYSSGGAAMAIFAVNSARERLQFNLSAVTVAEKLLFDILEAKYKWQ